MSTSIASQPNAEPPAAIRVVDAAELDRARWNAYVESHALATGAHLAEWAEVVQRTYGHRTSYLLAERNGTLCGVMALVDVHRPGFHRSSTSMPYLDTGGPLADDDTVWLELLRTARTLTQERGARLLDIRPAHQPPSGGAVVGDKVTLILELGDDAEALWKRIGSKTRNQVRKAEKSELRVERRDAAGVADFYRAYATNMRDLGSPPHPRSWFEHLFEAFGERAGCQVVLRDDEVIGGLIQIDCGHTTVVPWASSDRRYFKLCPNNLLYWETFRMAIERGIRHFDFGRSSRDSGTYRFKKQWGAEETPLFWQRIDPATGVALEVTGGSGQRERIAGLWKRLPVPVATWIGSRLRGDITL